MTDRRFSSTELERVAASALRAVGVSEAHADITASRLVEADARGRTGHGLIRLRPYVERIESGGLNPRPIIEVTRETPTSALLDGDNGLGPVIMTVATERAIEKARHSGMCWIGTVHSNHAGAAGLYPRMAARAGMIGMYLAVANANGLPPWGGIEPILGTNPIAIAVPVNDGPPFLLDIATTTASHGTIKVAAQRGEEMPVGWVVDHDGRPITDPQRADEGFLVPIGGYKGSGLNIAIGLLAGAMNGAAFLDSVVDQRVDLRTPTNTGQALFVMRADLFQPADVVSASFAAQLDRLRRSRTSRGDAVRLPGDIAARLEQESRVAGVALPEPLIAELDTLAARLGSESPHLGSAL